MVIEIVGKVQRPVYTKGKDFTDFETCYKMKLMCLC